MARNKILLVEDEPAVRFAVRDFLESKGFRLDEADSCQAALQAFVANRPDAVVLDYALPDGDALELLPKLKGIDPGVPLIVLTGHASIDLAVRAVKEGAEQFLTKPIELPALQVVLERALENQRNRQKSLARNGRGEEPDPFLGTSRAIRELRELASKAAAIESPILVQGETGTGKGVLARWLHAHSPRADEAMVDLNCAGLTREFLESELFGHERGAFTGATAAKPGMLEVAHRGTAFLDEIGDMDPLVQPKLLKVLEEKRFRRLGDVRDRVVDVRLIAATHQDLQLLVQEKRFRSDLYFRVSTIPLRVPALHERPEDLPAIAAELLRRICADLGRPPATLLPDALRTLQAYHWPGNIRELRNVLERAMLLSARPELGRDDLRFDFHARASQPAADTSLTLEEVECQHITRVLEEERGQVARAAERLGVPRSTLYQKIKNYRIVVAKP